MTRKSDVLQSKALHLLYLAMVGLLFLLPGMLRAEVTHVDTVSLQALMDTGMPVIDLRRADEWEHTGVIEGSHLMTFFDQYGRYDVQAWLEKLEAVADVDEPFILICARGVRSRNVARLLDQKLGYSRVYNVSKGILDWTATGGKLVPVNQ